MPAGEPQVFHNIGPEQYAALMQKAVAAGFAIAGNVGTASQWGVEVAWEYAPETRKLSIQCVSTPFLIGPEVVDARIRALVEAAVG